MLTERFLCNRRRRELSKEELEVVEGAIAEVRTIPPRSQVVTAGKPIHASTLLVEGLMCRYMDDRAGNRQIVAIHIPGDFVDLHGFPLKHLDHDVATITSCKVACVPHENLETIIGTHPHLSRQLWFSTLMDAAMHREWTFRLGRLDANQRIAHLFCELYCRMNAVGLAKDGSFSLAITQQDVGETCGITSVHVNRALRNLRNDGLVTFRSKKVVIPDRAKLAKLADFEPNYLFFDPDFEALS
ncbi:Crp/Fnr family transcriptional regulator [Sphingomonas naphthae]|uniref:Crp/Fnr family transcriptional regulator n=1 Tax=Sphingomonas naphthae TaxID=1813468 RepID=A0ABY7TR93_9SPHN|nr:Crp/Fnr family transcriptional regulator [Sphingomonas naphthae]WCT75465.1 Crp/Fnr family transcriptional regulator [Sphingomonas naphthae]